MSPRLIVLAMAVGPLLYGCSEGPLFAPPPRGGQVVPAPTTSDSLITLVASFPYATLVEIADGKIPKTTPLGGDGHIACAGVPQFKGPHVGSHEKCFDKPYLDFRGAGTERVCVQVPDFYGPSLSWGDQCADYHWGATVEKHGPVQIGRSGADLLLSQNIHIAGKAGVGGDLAKLLSLSGKSFDVHVAPAMRLNVGLDDQWCPIIKAEPVGKWVSSASVELVGRNCVGFDFGALGKPQVCAGPVNLGLADVLNSEIDKRRGDIEQAARKAVSCDKIRETVAEQWRPRAIRIDRPGQAPLFLLIEPKTAAFSGLIVEDRGAKLVARIGAKTVVSPSDVVPSASALPKLEPAAAENGRLDVAIQANAPYAFLKRELAEALVGRSFAKTTGAGAIEIRIGDVDIYPSNGSLAVGLKIDAKSPGRWFDTKGWAYLSGKPSPTADGKAIVVDDLKFSTVLDNEFWKIFQGVFESEILAALNSRSRFDISQALDEAAGRAKAAIDKAHVPNFKLTSGRPEIQLSGVYVASDDLTLASSMKIDLGMEFTGAEIH